MMTLGCACCLLSTRLGVEASGRHLLATANTTNTTITNTTVGTNTTGGTGAVTTVTTATGIYFGEQHCQRHWLAMVKCLCILGMLLARGVKPSLGFNAHQSVNESAT
jgi:hypothetical protein